MILGVRMNFFLTITLNLKYIKSLQNEYNNITKEQHVRKAKEEVMKLLISLVFHMIEFIDNI